MNVTVGGAVHPISLVGVTEGFNTVRRLVAVQGRYFDQDDMMSRSKVCLITEQLASSMFPYDDPLGKDLAIDELHFTVIGVFRERVATFGQTEITPETVIVPFPLIKDYTGTDYFKSFYAQADRPEDVPVVTERVAEVLDEPAPARSEVSRLESGGHPGGRQEYLDGLDAALDSWWR